MRTPLPPEQGPPTRPARKGPRVPSPLSLALALALLAAPAAAHADLESSEPADGARLPAAPGWVVLRLSGPIEPSASSLEVVGPDGARADEGDLRQSSTGFRPVLNVTLREGLGNGTYRVEWSILADDGHPNGSSFAFAVGDDAVLPGAGGGGGGSEGPAPAAIAGRALAYLGLALGLGAAAWLWLVRAGADGMAPAALAALALGGALHAAGSALLFASTLDSAGVAAGLLASSTVGRMLAFRVAAGLAAAVLAAVALALRGRLRLPGVAAALLLAAAAVASSAIGHPATHGVAGGAADAIHLLASTTWVGGLPLLLVALRKGARQGLGAEGLRRIGLRFGTVALACVLVLVASGLATTAVVLGALAFTDPLHLLDSLYGRLLLAKVGLAVAMVALAAANRLLFLAPAAPGARPGRPGWRARLAALGPDGTAAGLRRTVLLEALLGVAVLAVAGALTATSPTDHEAEHDGHVHDPAAAAVAGAADAADAGVATHPLITGPQDGAAMPAQRAASLLLHHDGTAGFDWVDAGIGALVVAALAGLGFLIYRLVQRRRLE